MSEAIADELFGSDHAGSPVYALPDSSALARIAAQAGLDGDALTEITEVVRATLDLDDPTVAPFRWQSEATLMHRHQLLETPPSLPLLVILTLAAESMHADGDVAAHNYYSRLHRLLKVPANRRHRVEEEYRRHAYELWGSLNAWLEAWEGERGIPTAYSVGGHAFVGLPMSQAVVRQHDRSGLHEFFELEGLIPGLRLSPSDMEIAMEPYSTTTPSPFSSHLRQLWKAPGARDRIVGAACIELEAWNGSRHVAAGIDRRLPPTRLLAFLRTFPRKSIEFNLMFPYRSDGPDFARFDLMQGEVTVSTVAGPGSSTRMSSIATVNASSLTGEALTGVLGRDERRPFARRPKRVVPLRWDDLQGAYVEVESIALGEDSLVLVRANARLRVETHLGVHSRPGWRELPLLSGLPEGWLLYEHVQMISAPSKLTHFDLLPLTPRARTSLSLRGGFVLPGLLRKWSSLEPPEVVALAAGASSLTVRVHTGTRVDPAAAVVQVDQDGELAVVPLLEHRLGDGEYVVAMFVDGDNRPSSTAVLRLRSADSPQFRVEEADIRLVYSPEAGATWPLQAGAVEWERFVNGARPVQLTANCQQRREVMREFAPRERPRVTASQQRVRVGIPMADDSCLVTGMHRFILPPVMPGRPRTRTVEGECTTCGLLRRFATTAWNARRKDRDSTRSSLTVAIPPLLQSDEPDFQVAFDALNHIGHGSFATFERIAAQIEGSGLFADSFLRRQEVVGHIDVARNDWFQVAEWAVNSATLVPIGPRCWVLIGSRSRGMVNRLRELIGERGQVCESVDAELSQVEVTGVLPAHATLARIGVEVLDEPPSLSIAASLPKLSEVASKLKRIAVPAYRTAEVWDTRSASWCPADSIHPSGAYRFNTFRSLYVIRSAEDIKYGTVAIGNAQLVKHIANLWAADPLAGYHSRSGSVVVPLGADLPGLYGRTLSLCSGRAPREIEKHRMLCYPSVPRDVADAVFTRLIQ
ncbi:hypothetical protein [Kocuria arenosa]|uniref:hypothetical protein n=1 Tax=Kocuria arenosa TaxID=3071446 RepID=UPI0034D6825E